MSWTGGHEVTVAMRDCGISMTSQTRPFCKHCFSAFQIDKMSPVEARIGLLWRSFCPSYDLATGCGIKAKDPSGLDSDRWIPHSRCCENPARAKALAGFSRHLSAGFTDLNPAPRGLSLFLPPSWRHTPGVTHMRTLGLLTPSSHCGDSSHFPNIDMYTLTCQIEGRARIDMYSHMPNRRAGQNIRSGWHISSK